MALCFSTWSLRACRKAWHSTAQNLDGAQFAPLNATSSGAIAMRMRGALYPILYFVGVGSCIYHLANGLWTFGITWGLWVTPEAQKRALYGCGAFGVLLSVIGLTAWAGFAITVDPDAAYAHEEKQIERRLETGDLTPEEAEAKRAHAHKKETKPQQKSTANADVETSGS